MGCSTSTEDNRNGSLPEPKAPPPPDPRLPLTARQKFSLQKSWKAVQRGMEDVGVNAFIRMFKDIPESQDLFPSYKGKKEHQLRQDLGFENTATMMMNIFDEVVEDIDDLDSAINLCNRTGKNHKDFGLTPDLLNKFEGYLLGSIKDHLEERYTEKMEEIYTTMVKFVIKHMIAGLEGG